MKEMWFDYCISFLIESDWKSSFPFPSINEGNEVFRLWQNKKKNKRELNGNYPQLFSGLNALFVSKIYLLSAIAYWSFNFEMSSISLLKFKNKLYLSLCSIPLVM